MQLDLRLPAIANTDASGNRLGYASFALNLQRELLAMGIEVTTAADTSLFLGPPHLFEPVPGKRSGLYSMWEVHPMPQDIVASLNRADVIIVPSAYCASLFRRNGVRRPIHVVPLGIDPDDWPVAPRIRRRGEPLRFLWVNARAERKGWTFLGKAWAEAFVVKSPMMLTIKTSVDPGESEPPDMYNSLVRVRTIARRLSWEELRDLYCLHHVFICTSTAEGFGLCVSPDTLIQVAHGGVKTMAQISQGERVLAGDGRFHRVLRKVSRVSETIKVKCHGAPWLTITPEHPFLRLPKRSDPPAYYERHPLDGLSWARADTLQVGDYVATPRPKWDKPLPKTIDILDYINDFSVCADREWAWYAMGYSPATTAFSLTQIQRRYDVSKGVAEDARRILNEKFRLHHGYPGSVAWTIAERMRLDQIPLTYTQQRIRRHVKLDKDFLTFLGWYVAEGSCTDNGVIEFSLHLRERPIAEWLSDFIAHTFGLKGVVEQNGPQQCRMTVCSKILSALLRELCGRGAHNKAIHPMVLQSAQFIAPLIRAYMLGDGYTWGYGYSMTTVSERLAWQLRGIFATVGIYARISYTSKRGWDLDISGDAAARYEAWVGIPSGSQQTRRRAIHVLVTDDYLFVPVKDLQSGHIQEVMDIEVEQSHDFVGNGILLHNSPLEAMACGLLVISPRHTGLAEYVHKGVAWLVATDRVGMRYEQAQHLRVVAQAPKVSELKGLIRRAVVEFDATESMRVKAMAHAKTFTWRRSAETLIEALARFGRSHVA